MKRIFHLLKKVRQYRSTARRMLKQTVETQTKLSTLTKEFMVLQDRNRRLEQIFKYDVLCDKDFFSRSKRCTLQISDVAIKYVKDRDALVMDVARQLVTQILQS